MTTTARPRLSGFCNAGNPDESHGRCRLDGCSCTCHVPAGRVKVPLACLQGQHTATCEHPSLLERLADQSVPAGTTVTYEVGDGLDPPGVQLGLDVLPDLTLEERRLVIAGHLELDPAAALHAARTIIRGRLDNQSRPKE